MNWTWDDAKVLAYDLETSGTLPEYALQPWRLPAKQSWVTSVSVIEHSGTALVARLSKLFPDVSDLRGFLEHVVANDLTVVGWNVTFDISWLIAMGLGDLAHKVRWLDAMLLWRHFEIEPEYEFKTQQHKRKSYALKPGGIDRFLPVMKGYNDDIDFHTVDPESLAKLQAYNDRDSVCTWIIAAVLWEQLGPKQRNAALIEAQSLSMIAEANVEGMLVDVLACRELGVELKAQACDLLSQLEPYGMTDKIARSPVQLAKLIFDDWGLPVLKENTSKITNKTTRSTDKEVLHELAFNDPRAKQVKQYREALGNEAKFSRTILESVDYNGDGRTHPGAICFGTYSGRLTYSSSQGKNKDKRQTGFALHQEKRDEQFRNVIIAPAGYTLVEFDAANQEIRWMAIASGDETMLKGCLPGEDLHSLMGSRIGGWSYPELMAQVEAKNLMAKNLRQLGKVSNLSLSYRTSAKTLRKVARVQYDIPLELDEARRIWKTYQHTYPRVPDYWSQQISVTRQTGYVETLAGRRVQVVGNWDGDWGWSMGSTAINYRIQGTGADQKYLALQVIKPYLVSIGARFAWDMHDGLYFYIPTQKLERALVDIKQLLDNLPYKEAWGFTPSIPLPFDAKVGTSWGNLKPWKFN